MKPQISDHSVTGNEGPDGKDRSSSTLSITLELDGVGGQRHAPDVLPAARDPVPIAQEAGWAPGSGLDGCGKSRHHRYSIPGTVHPVADHLKYQCL